MPAVPTSPLHGALHERAIRIHLLGRLRVEFDGTTLGPRDFGGIKPKQILEILVLRRGRPVAKDQLAELLWGEQLPRNVAATLETYVSNVRSAFRPTRLGHSLVITDRDAYRLDPALCVVDVDVLEELAGDRVDGRPVRASLERALSLVAGELLEDEPWAEWAEGARIQARRLAMQVRLDLAEVLLAERDIAAAAAHAESALAEEALDERAVRAVMLCRYAQGRQGEALDAYRACRSMLGRDLGLDVTPETRALEAAILRQTPIDDLLPAPAAPTPAPTPIAAPGAVTLASVPTASDRRATPRRAGDAVVDSTVVDAALASACSMVHTAGGGDAMVRLLGEAAALWEHLRNEDDPAAAAADVLEDLIGRLSRLPAPRSTR